MDGGGGRDQEGFSFEWTEVASGTQVRLFWADAVTFATHCGGKRYACAVFPTFPDGCLRNINVWFDASEPYSSLFPVDNPLHPSLEWVAAHELGHGLGLGHEDDLPALMNSMKFHGGDANRTYRLHADEFLAMHQYAGSFDGGDTGSTPNLLLYGFTGDRPFVGLTYEVWTDSTSLGVWDLDQGECVSPPAAGDYYECCLPPFDEILAVNNSSSDLHDVVVRFYLTQDSDPDMCSGGIQIAEEVIGTLSPGVPFPVLIDWTNPSNGIPYAGGTPHDLYRVCAMIDPEDAVAESSELDNFFTSEYASLELLPPKTSCS